MTETSWRGHRPHEPMLAADLATDLEPDREARFRAIYEREFAFVWSAARYFGVPPAARDDVVQDVFLTAFRRLDQVHYQVSARAWLYGVTRRVASHYHRGAARRARRLAALTDMSPKTGEAPHERHDAARLLERLLAGLPRGTRDVWELTELLGMSGPEIAAELELPLNTVYSRLRLARAQLQAQAADRDVLAACVAAARRREAPPPAASARNWAVMVPLLAPGKLVPLAAAWTTARTGVMTTLIVAGATVAAVAAPTRRAPDLAAARGEVEHLSERTSSEKSRAASPITDTSQETAFAAATDLSPGTAPSPTSDLSPGTASAPAAPGTAPAAATGAWPSAADLSRETSPAAADDLAAEVALLDRARARLDVGDPEAAAALLAAHAREFPRGALVDAREAAGVEVLCLRGLRSDAEAAARRLSARLPDSVLARRFDRYVCADAPAPRR